MAIRWLNCLCSLILAIPFGVASSENSVRDCSVVQIVTMSSLDFGHLRISGMSKGIVVMDSVGGLSTDSGVAVASGAGASPAIINVSGPSDTHVYISLVERREREASNSVRLVDLKLSQMGRELPRVGNFWIVRLPRSTKETTSTTVSMSGTLELKGFGHRKVLTSTVDLSCQFVTQPLN